MNKSMNPFIALVMLTNETRTLEANSCVSTISLNDDGILLERHAGLATKNDIVICSAYYRQFAQRFQPRSCFAYGRGSVHSVMSAMTSGFSFMPLCLDWMRRAQLFDPFF